MSRRGENIRKRKDGRWEGRYYAHEPASHRKVSRSVYAKTYNETKEKLLLARLSEEAAQAEKGPAKEIRFQAVAQEWLKAVENSKKHSTFIKYRSIYEKYLSGKLDGLCFSEFDGDTLLKIFQENADGQMSKSLMKTAACVLNQILSYAESHYHVKTFRYSYQKQKTGSRPVEVLNQTEQAKLLQYLYDGMDIYKMGIVICISTGLRLGEICSLKWEDVDLKGKVLHVNTTVQRIAVDREKSRTMLLEGSPKSIFSKREIPLSEDMVRLLTPYYSESARYVINRSKPMEPRTYQNKFQSYLQMAGVKKKNFHSLRHTFATNCINSGADVKSLSEILGHSDVKITLNRYVHPTLETKRQHMNSLSAVYGQIMGQ